MKKLFALLSVFALFVSGAALVSAQTNSNCVMLTHDMTIGVTDANTDGEVTKLQNFLIARGFLNLDHGKSSALGTFGQQTNRAVSSFQKAYGIIATGYVGPLTRANIQTLTCAIGTADTSNLPTTVISTSSLPLLTFTSPGDGAIVVKGEKDITPDWTVSTVVKTLFASSTASTTIKIELIDSTGAVVGEVGKPMKLSARNNNRVENNFVRTLASKGRGRFDNVIDPGQYRLRATLVYSGSDATLIAAAGRYAAESGWFSVVDPVPTPNLRLSVSSTTIPISQPVTLTWTSATSSNCTLFDGVATTTLTSSGTKDVTPTQAITTYTVECALTSAWPLPGSSYTTTEKKSKSVVIGTPGATITSAAVSGTNLVVTGTATSSLNVGLVVKNSSGSTVYSGTASVSNGTYNKSIMFGIMNPNPSTHPGTYTVGLYVPAGASSPVATRTVVIGANTCATGQVWNGTGCIPTPTCNSEQHLENGSCVNNTRAYTCSNGTVVQVPANVTVNSSNEAQFCSITTNPPTITSVGPNITPVGGNVVITGTGFSATGNRVYVNYSPTSATKQVMNTNGFTSNGTRISFTLPAATTCLGPSSCQPITFTYNSYSLTVANANGTSSAKMFVVPSAYQNFIGTGGTQAACNQQILDKFGSQVATCSQYNATSAPTSGGCTQAGTPPDATHPPLNSGWGACVSSSLVIGAITPNCTTNPSDPACGTLYTCNGVVSHDPCTNTGPAITLSNIGNSTVSSGGTTTLSWSVTPTSGVTCAAAEGSTVVGGNNVVSLSSSGWDTPPIYTTTTFGLRCTNATGQSSVKTLTVNVSQVSSGTGPSVTLTSDQGSITSGGSATLRWSVTPADATCVAAQGTSVINDGNPIPLVSPDSGWSTPALYTQTTYGMRCANANGTTTKTVRINVSAPAGTLLEPSFTAQCQRSGSGFKINLKWNRVSGATNYPVRLQGPSFATNATQYNGQSVVGFNNPGVADAFPAPTGTSYTFNGLTAAGDYTFWGHAWAPGSDGSGGIWSSDTPKTVTCSSARTSADDDSDQLAQAPSTATVLGAATACTDLPYNFHRGNESQSVTNLQNFLIANRYLSGNATGFFGDQTVEAVKAYQGARGLPQTGMVYDFTRNAIRAETCQ